MKKRLGILMLAGVLTFNQAGLVAFAQEPAGEGQKAAREVEVTGKLEIGSSANATVRFQVEDLDEMYSRIYAYDVKINGTRLVEGTDYTISSTNPGSYQPTEVTFMMLKAYDGIADRNIIIDLDTKGYGEYSKTVTILQKGSGSGVEQTISDVKEVSRELLADKSTKIVYEVTGTNLDKIGIKAKKEGAFVNLDQFDLTVSSTGTAEKQTVTLTFNNVFSAPEGSYTIKFYPSQNTSGTAAKEITTVIDPNAVTPPVVTAPTLTGVTASQTNITAAETTVEFTLTGTNLTADTGVAVIGKWSMPVDVATLKKTISGTGNEQKITLTFPAHTDVDFGKEYNVNFFANGNTEDTADTNMKSVKIVQAAAEEATITSVTPEKQTVDNDNREVTFTLNGTALTTTTKVTVKKDGADVTIDDINVTGSGTSQTVTMTMPENTSTESDAVYSVEFNAKGQVNSPKKYATVTVEAKAPVLKDALEKAIEDALNYLSDDGENVTVVGYTEETAEALINAYQYAVGVNENDAVIQDIVNKATEALTKAIDGLVVDKSQLEEILSWEEEYDEELWTADTWKALEEAYVKVHEVYDDENATPQDVQDAVAAYNSADAGLVSPAAEEADKAALKETIDKASGLNKDDYTADSWIDFEAALDAAKEAYEDEAATKFEVAVAKSYLEEAMGNLKGVTKPTDPTKPADPSNPTNPGSQTKPADSNKDDKKDNAEKKAPKTADPASIAILALQGTLAAGVGATVLKRRKEDEE